MSPDPARIAGQDQDMAEVRDLVQLVHEHRQSGVCDPQCPGWVAILRLVAMPPGRWLSLLVAALVRVDDLQTGVASAVHTANPDVVNPLDHPWHP